MAWEESRDGITAPDMGELASRYRCAAGMVGMRNFAAAPCVFAAGLTGVTALPASVASMQDEQRQHERRPIDLVVEVQAPIKCVLTDVSELGARLAVDCATVLPNEFMLVLNNELRRWCRVKWRSDGHVGVEFVAMPEAHVRSEDSDVGRRVA